jgi:hypothetical protein
MRLDKSRKIRMLHLCNRIYERHLAVDRLQLNIIQYFSIASSTVLSDELILS